MAKVGVVLSGCGVFDGSEINETVLTLLALDRAGAEVICMAPNMEQLHVVNHLSGEIATDESRNVLVESARIARGNIKDMSAVQVGDFDALVIPGGFGAAKNLCDFATKGVDCVVHSEVKRLVLATVNAGKPLAAICIAPALIAKVIGAEHKGVQLTIGSDSATAEAMENMGAKHVECTVDDYVFDKQLKILSTPAYMLAGSISEAAAGIEKTISALLKLV
jgi:enhancing lycopene biosynthesis protein 2